MFLKVKLKYDCKHYFIFNEFCVIADRTIIGNALVTNNLTTIKKINKTNYATKLE